MMGTPHMLATPIRQPTRATGLRFVHPPCDGKRIRNIVPSLGYAEVRFRVRMLIVCAARHMGANAARALCIAGRESSYWPWAENPSGSWGLFQVIPSTWASWFNAYPMVRRWIRRASPTVPVESLRLVAYANAMLSMRVLRDTAAPWGGGSYSC